MQAVGLFGVIPLAVAGMLGMGTSPAMGSMKGISEGLGFGLAGSLFTNAVAPVTQCMQQLDLALLVDRSGSIKEEHWAKMITFLKDIVLSLSLDKNDVRLALVTYGSSINQYIGFLDPASRSEALALKLLSSMQVAKPLGEYTYTGGALKFLEDQVFIYGRKHVPNVVIVVTDGVSTNYWSTGQQSSLMRFRGYTIMVVGVGEANAHECRGIVGCDEGVACPLFVHTNWNQMKELVSKFMTEICLTVARDAVCEPVWDEWSECSSPCGVKGIRTRPLRQLKTLVESTAGSNGKIGRSCAEQVSEFNPPEESCKVECVLPAAGGAIGVLPAGVATVINLDDGANPLARPTGKDNGADVGISPGGVTTVVNLDDGANPLARPTGNNGADVGISPGGVATGGAIVDESKQEGVDNLAIVGSGVTPAPNTPKGAPVGPYEKISGADAGNLISAGGVFTGGDTNNAMGQDDLLTGGKGLLNADAFGGGSFDVRPDDILVPKRPEDELMGPDDIDEDLKTKGAGKKGNDPGKSLEKMIQEGVDSVGKILEDVIGDGKLNADVTTLDDIGTGPKGNGTRTDTSGHGSRGKSVEDKVKEEEKKILEDILETKREMGGQSVPGDGATSMDAQGKIRGKNVASDIVQNGSLDDFGSVGGSRGNGVAAKGASVVVEGHTAANGTRGHSALVGIPVDDAAKRNEVIRRHNPAGNGRGDVIAPGKRGAAGGGVISPGNLGGSSGLVGNDGAFDYGEFDEKSQNGTGGGRESYGPKVAGGVAIAALFLGAAGGYTVYKRRRQMEGMPPDSDAEFDSAVNNDYRDDQDENFTVSEMDNGLWAEAN